MVPSPTLLRIAIAGLVPAALPIVVHPGLWVFVVAGWLGMAFVLLLEAASLAGCVPELRCSVPAEVGIGRAAKVDVRFTGRRRALEVTLRAECTGGLESGEDVEVEVTRRGARTTLELTSRERGPGRLEAVWLRVRSRFGLLHRHVRRAVGAELSVVPNLPAVGRLALRSSGHGPMAGNGFGRGLQAGSELQELQRYAAGMDVRAIDWKASARQEELRVRRFRPEQNQRVVVVLDLGRPMHERSGGLSRLDHSIHTALALTQLALRNGDQVALQAFGVRPGAWVGPGGGASQLRKLVRIAGRLQPDARPSNPVSGLRALSRRLTRRSLVVVFSHPREGLAAELMNEALAGLARKHRVALVVPDDEETIDPFDVVPADLEQVARSLARADLARERRRALERHRQRGVEVVTGPPGIASVAVLDRYLDLKRRGRLG